MRAFVTAAFVLSIALACPLASHARQRVATPNVQQIQPVARPTAPPPIHFRTRTAAERLTTANRLVGNITPSQMSTPFSLTARNPVADGRGVLSSIESMNFPGVDTSGELGIHPQQAVAILELLGAAGRRFLVDCTVSVTTSASSNTARVFVDYRTVGSGPSGTIAQLDVATGMLSFVTPVFSAGQFPQNHDREIRIQVIHNISSPTYFWIYGCEITPLQ